MPDTPPPVIGTQFHFYELDGQLYDYDGRSPAPAGATGWRMTAPTRDEAAALIARQGGPQQYNQTAGTNYPTDRWITDQNLQGGVDLGDIGRSAGTGLLRGLYGLGDFFGVPAALGALGVDEYEGATPGIWRLGANAMSWLSHNTWGASPYENNFDRYAQGVNDQYAEQYARDTAGLHVPQTQAGQAAANIAEFLPGGYAARGTVRFGLVPGIAAEAAGQLSDGTPAEPYWRMAGAILGGLGGAYVGGAGQGGTFLSRAEAGASARMLAQRLRDAGVTQDDITAANQIMQSAREVGPNGVQITWPEALAQATNGRIRLTDIQRLVEQTGGGSRLAGAMATRQPVFREAFEQQFNSPSALTPAATAAQLREASTELIDNTRRLINDATAAAYFRSGGELVDRETMDILYDNPLFRQTMSRVQNDPTYHRLIGGFPDNDPRVLKLVSDELDAMARSSAANDFNLTRSAAQGGVGAEAMDAATRTSPNMAWAEATQAARRQSELDPLQVGMVGAMARPAAAGEANAGLGTQLGAVFQRDPYRGAANESADLFSYLSVASPEAAANAVRLHVQHAIDDAFRVGAGGPNQNAASSFAANIAGRTEQRAVLEAAVRNGVPNGDEVWEGFQRLLQVAEASGRRLPANSATAPNAELYRDLAQGGRAGEAVTNIADPRRWFSLNDWWNRLNIRRNSAQLADLLLDPNNVEMWRGLAQSNNWSDALQIATALVLGGQSATDPTAFLPSNAPPTLPLAATR